MQGKEASEEIMEQSKTKIQQGKLQTMCLHVCCMEAAYLFPRRLATQTQNNHTETVLIKSLIGLLALSSFGLALTY